MRSACVQGGTDGRAVYQDKESEKVKLPLKLEVAKEFVQVCLAQDGQMVIGFFKQGETTGFVIPVKDEQEAQKLAGTFWTLFVQAMDRYESLKGV